MSARRIFAVVLHASAVAILSYGYLELEKTVLNSYIITQRGGHSQFLTIQALIITWFTMLVSMFCDMFPRFQGLKLIKRSFFLIAMPLAVVVTTIYWSLLLFFPSLILSAVPSSPGSASEPSSSPEVPALLRLPLRHDLSLHAAPAISLLLDFFLLEKKYGPSAASWGAMITSIMFGTWYSIWVEWCAAANGHFPYPFLTVNELPGRIVIYTIVTIIAFISFRGLNALHK